MPDDKQYVDGENGDAQNPEEPSELPASVIFMEMMRRAAASQTPPQPKPVRKPPIVRHQRQTEPLTPRENTPESSSADAVAEVRLSEPPAVRPEASAENSATIVPTLASSELAVEKTEQVEQTKQAEPVETLDPVPPPEQPPAPRPKRPLTEEERREAAALEAQRIQRIKRRQQKRRARNVGILSGLLRSFIVVFVSAGLMATILSWWTDSNFLSLEMRRSLQSALATGQATVMPTYVPTPNWLRTIGIVSGHRGPGQEAPYDPGAVCPDGITENEINFNVASRVVDNLRARGYRAELLEEFDARLNDYHAETLVSIHANTCQQFPGGASGFMVAKAAARAEFGEDARLAECIAAYYGPITGLERRMELTVDMTDYHSFREIHPLTPAAIIELGFMHDDRELLTEKPDLLAQAIVEGILCYIAPETIPPAEVTPLPSPEGSE